MAVPLNFFEWRLLPPSGVYCTRLAGPRCPVEHRAGTLRRPRTTCSRLPGSSAEGRQRAGITKGTTPLLIRGVNLYVLHASLTDFRCFDWPTDVRGNPYGFSKKKIY